MNSEGRTEVIGAFSITGFVQYLSDVQVWEPRIVIARIDGAAQDFVVPVVLSATARTVRKR